VTITPAIAGPRQNISPALVSNALLKVVFEEGIWMTTTRLQCLLFQLEVRTVRDTGFPLIGSPFLAHKYGPRLGHIDAQYGLDPDSDILSNRSVRRYAKDAEGLAYLHYDLAMTGRIYSLLAESSDLSTEELIDGLRAPGTPWFTAWQARQRYVSDRSIALYAGRLHHAG
jgi:uncharacterized phage-associated protein